MNNRKIGVLVLASSRAVQISWSVNSSKGSKFNLSVVLNSTGSWGIIEILFLKSVKPIVFVSKSSISTCPRSVASLNRAVIKEDFPAPVRPTTPIYKFLIQWYYNQ